MINIIKFKDANQIREFFSDGYSEPVLSVVQQLRHAFRPTVLINPILLKLVSHFIKAFPFNAFANVQLILYFPNYFSASEKKKNGEKMYLKMSSLIFNKTFE